MSLQIFANDDNQKENQASEQSNSTTAKIIQKTDWLVNEQLKSGSEVLAGEEMHRAPKTQKNSK